MSSAIGLAWDLFATDKASPAFLRVAGAADKAAASTARATRGMAESTARMGALGKRLTTSLTLPLAAIAAVSLDQAAKFQKSMTLIQTAGGETAAKAAAIGKGIEKLAMSTGTSLQDLSDGIYTVAKAGGSKWSAAEQLNILKAAAQGAKAENVDLGTAVNALTSVMMSYHMSAAQAVQVENQLIRGSGLAKTTMQDYAGALSTVVPIASAAHISFAQVAGAIATLTQHGTTADEATQELSNTIRNLLQPNNVASKAMQQLGLNVVDVEKNLGKRGLTGTIDLLTTAIAKKMGPSGLVAVDVFKRSQSASADLNIELAKMPGKLGDLSKQFMSGTIGYSAYLKAIKKLDAGQYELGKSFISTLGQAKGFNDLLKAGNPAAQTFAGYLKQVMGGATGLNTALQLGGENMAYFQSATKAVGKAALDTGSDVLGWNKTQDTLAVKMDKAKASIQVLAVEIGTALIPVVSKIATGVQAVVKWFDGLSGTQKSILGWSAGVLLALGPILALGSRLSLVGRGITTFAANAAGRISSLVGASADTAAKVQANVRRMVGGVSAALAGAAAGSMFNNVSGGGGWLGSILLGGATGWAIGGGNPVMAAIGAVSGAISHGISLWGQHKDAAKQAAEAEKQYVDSLTSAINADNGALGMNVKLSVTKALQDQGILDQAQKLGISLSDVVAGAMGNSGALQRSIIGPEKSLEAQLNAKQAYLQAHPNITPAQAAPIQRQVQSLYSQIQAYEKLQTEITGSSGDTNKAIKQYAQFEHIMNDNRVATGSFTTQLGALKKQTTLAVDMNGQLVTTLDRGTVVGAHNANVIDALGKAAQVDAEKTFAAALKHESYADAVRKASGVLATHVRQIESAASAAGLDKDAVARLIEKYGKIPTSVLTYIKKKGVLPADVQAIVDAYNRIPKSITTVVSVKTVGDLASTYRSQVPLAAQHRAAGGSVADGYFTVGERGYELGYKQGSKVTIFPHAQAVAMTGMKRVPGYAAGTKAPTGQTLTDIVSGISALLAAAHNMLATASDLSDAAKQLRDAAKAGKASSAALSRFAKEQKVLGQLGAQRDRVSARLGTAPTAPTAYDRLASAQQAYGATFSGVRSAAVGSFDITTAGQTFADQPATAGSILAALKQQAAKAGQFGQLLKRLAKAGLNRVLLGQLATAGPVALAQAQALAAATPQQILGLNAGYKDLVAAADSSGTFLAQQLNGAGVSAAQGLVKGLQSQESSLTKAIRKLGDEMVRELKDSLKIHSPSQVMRDLGGNTGEGFRLGLMDKQAAVKRAAAAYHSAVTSGGGRGGGNVYQFYGLQNLDEIAAAVQRREYMAAV